MGGWTVIHDQDASPAEKAADVDVVQHLARFGALEAAERVMDRLDSGEDVGEVLTPAEVEARLAKFCAE